MAFNINSNDFSINQKYGLRYRDDIQILQYYDPSSDIWVDVNGIGAQYLDDLLDVTITSVAAGDFLYYNGTNWINRTFNTIVTGGTVVDSSLRWDGVDWIESTSFLNDSSSNMVFFGDSSNANYPVSATNIFAYFKNLQSLYIGDASGGELDVANIFSYCLSVGNNNQTSANYQYAFGQSNVFNTSSSYNVSIGNSNAFIGSSSFVFGMSNNLIGGDSGVGDLNVMFAHTSEIKGNGTFNFVHGYSNVVDGTGFSAVFGLNHATKEGNNHFIGGGDTNEINQGAIGGLSNSAIIAGNNNTISAIIAAKENSVIVGGETNVINSTSNSVIVGGFGNTLNSGLSVGNNTVLIAVKNVTESEAETVAISNLKIYGDTVANTAKISMRNTTDQPVGSATLVASVSPLISSVTVANSTVIATSLIYLTAQDANINGQLYVVKGIGTFDIISTDPTDTAEVAYFIVNLF